METVKDQVHALLRPRRWIAGETLEHIAGPSALRRLRELRADYEIKTRKAQDQFGTYYEYRLVGPRS